jgi:S1-C subfamily serine protease
MDNFDNLNENSSMDAVQNFGNEQPESNIDKQSCIERLKQKTAGSITVKDGYVAVRPFIAILLAAIILLTFCLNIILIVFFYTTHYKPEIIYKSTLPSVVDVLCYDARDVLISHGTGFFISKDGEIATCFHVIDECVKIGVVTYDGNYYIVEKIISFDSENDLAVIRINKTDCKPLAFATEEARIGERIYAVANYQNGVANLMQGIVSRSDYQGQKTGFTYAAPISAGCSGGPMLNEKGEVLGVISTVDATTYNTGGAIYASNISNMTRMPMDMAKFLEKSSYDIGHLMDYKTTEEGLILTGLKGTTSKKYVTIPSTINGRSVVAIEFDFNSIQHMGSFVHISISEGIKRIGNNSFVGASQLLSISLPSSLESVEPHALAAPKLVNIMIPENSILCYDNGVLYDQDKTVLYFYGRDKTETTFTVPDSVKVVSQGAFASNIYIKSVVLNAALTDLGSNYTSLLWDNVGVFEGCTSLQNVIFNGAEVWIIGPEAFRGCTRLKKLFPPASVKAISDYAFADCINFAALVFSADIPILAKSLFLNSDFAIIYAPPEYVNKASERPELSSYLEIIKYDYFYTD